MSAPDIPVDVDVLRREIQQDLHRGLDRAPSATSSSPPAGAGREDLGYPGPSSRACPTRRREFAGVANPFSLGELAARRGRARPRLGRRQDSLVAAQMVGPDGASHRRRHDAGDARSAPAARAADRPGERRAPESQVESAAVEDASLRRRHLQRRDRPHPGQGRGIRRAPPRPQARRPPTDRRRHDPAAEVSEEGRAQHRPLDRLNRRGSAGSRVRAPARSSAASSEIEAGDLIDTYARSGFDDTRRKAASTAPWARPSGRRSPRDRVAAYASLFVVYDPLDESTRNLSDGAGERRSGVLRPRILRLTRRSA